MLTKMKSDTDSELRKNSQDLIKDLWKLLLKIQKRDLQSTMELEAAKTEHARLQEKASR